jgi:hypothetical protein
MHQNETIGRDLVKKLLLSLTLAVLVAGLVLSAVVNISVCAWGCPQTITVYSMQASFLVLLGLIAWIVVKLVRTKA